MLSAGQRVGDRYLVLGTLGAGGAGVVYRAFDDRLEREVAIKVVSDERAADDEARRELVEEARSVAGLPHLDIAQVFDVGITEDGAVYVVMERVEGRTLRQILEAGPVSLEDAVRIVTAAAATLGAAHERGLLHRDVKPENAMVDTRGRVVLLDFGLATSDDDRGLSRTTRPGSGRRPCPCPEPHFVGSPGYASPEQVTCDPCTPASDQFQLAVVAYELLTGRSPWVGRQPAEVMDAILRAPPLAAAEAGRPVPPAVERVLHRALAKAPEDRFPSATAFATALREAAGATPRSPAHVQRFAGRAAAATLALVLVATAVWGFRGRATTAPLAEPGAVVACPLLPVEGVAHVAGWYGAAVADYACRRIGWLRGGADRATRTPAELLDVPVLPGHGFGAEDPYALPDARARSVEAARAFDAHLDGRVTVHAIDDVTVELVVRGDDGRASQPARARARSWRAAVVRATDALASTGAVPVRPLDPAVARWWGVDRPGDGLRVLDFRVALGVAGDPPRAACRALLDDVAGAPPALRDYVEVCEAALVGEVAGVPHAAASVAGDGLPARAWRAILGVSPDHGAAARSMAEALGAAKAPLARSMLLFGEYSSLLFAGATPRDVVHVLRAAIEARPRDAKHRAYHHLARLGTDGEEASAAAHAAWCPHDQAAHRHHARAALARNGRDAVAVTERALWIAGARPPVVALVEVFAARGRAAEFARRVAHLRSRVALPPVAEALVSAFTALEDGDFGRAHAVLDDAFDAVDHLAVDAIGARALALHLELADLLGRREETADALVRRFLLGGEPAVAADALVRGNASALASLCLWTGEARTRACVRAVEGLARARRTVPAFGFDDCLAAARARSEGDGPGAVAALRRAVRQGPAAAHGACRPAPALLDAWGATDLARRLDAPLLDRADYRGVHPALAREALRARDAGDLGRAARLAARVVAAWEGADVAPPILPRIRGVLDGAGDLARGSAPRRR